ncbi:MAG: 23S rRNA (guanosine(2251)-2'-O)-methyltransferase RlmB [Oscillospiraceae bacterium]|jgi:23S rRNA (guanosine2251-2'-O)-methyltransferase|nr:23S rRNA (guanosine(2251)-2'-O)-methyltransferase RlmB [Oscillospiraceae bacterium]
MAPEREEDEGRIEGKNPVMEALKAGRRIDKLYIAKGENDRALAFIAAKARAAGAVISETDRKKLDHMSVTHAHQGVIAVAAVKDYVTPEAILDAADQKGEKPFIIICDDISDPHNLGAIIRTAEAAGAHGVIIPKHRSAGVTAVVEKTSAGAVEHMLVARVANLAAAVKSLKDRGVWIFGTDADGDRPLWKADFRDSAAIVIGSEGKGMSRLMKESCDFLISIPMMGQVNSLNASAAAAVVMYEAVRQRLPEQ